MGAAGSLCFAVQDWYAWAPWRDTRAAWLAWACPHANTGGGSTADASSHDPAAVLPMLLRRRTTAVGNRAAIGALGMGEAAGGARYVLASRHGELGRSVGILGAIVRGESPSPTEFSMAVHHGLTGLLSIHARNRAGHTAIAADADAFGYGLVEAAACLVERPDQSVLVIYADDELPDHYAAFRQAEDDALPLVVVLNLTASTASGGIAMRREPADTGDGDGMLAIAFLRFLLAGDERAEVQGRRARWCWQRNAA